MDAFMSPGRDRSITVKCIKCQTPIAQLEVKIAYKIAMYVCEPCFLKLDNKDKKC